MPIDAGVSLVFRSGVQITLLLSVCVPLDDDNLCYLPCARSCANQGFFSLKVIITVTRIIYLALRQVHFHLQGHRNSRFLNFS